MPNKTATAAPETAQTTAIEHHLDHEHAPRRRGRLEPFSVLYAAPDTPEQVHVEVLQAPSEAAARSAAEHLFAGYDVLAVCPTERPRDAAFPRARFIKGRFHHGDRPLD
ncbi:MAG: hypothetical protein H6907_20525 [Hyphomicrobiales bacterium]|nr:hypothetical protein [Hyphomicrobiales bacterium]MCP5374128.1 hypothetical protein [Hyphomicrobiales bacterium]